MPPNTPDFQTDSDGFPLWPPRFAELDKAIERSVAAILSDGQWGSYHTPIHAQCESAVAETLAVGGTRPSLRLTPSGSAAVELGLRTLGVGPQSGPSKTPTRVILSAYDYPGNFRTIELLGGRPVLCDVEPGGLSPAVESIRSIDAPPKSVLVVSHLHGELADMTSLAELCRDRGWRMLEDACQAAGAGWHRRSESGTRSFVPVGQWSDVATLSFGGSKPLTCGNGGAIFTHRGTVFEKLKTIVDRPSDTFPMSPLQCAVLKPQLNWLARMNEIRCSGATRLASLDWSTLGCTAIWKQDPNVTRSPYKFPLLAKDAAARSAAMDRLRAIGVPCGEGFRSMHATSDRRSDKPVPLDHAAELGRRLLVIDHRALLAAEIESLSSCLA